MLVFVVFSFNLIARTCCLFMILCDMIAPWLFFYIYKSFVNLDIGLKTPLLYDPSICCTICEFLLLIYVLSDPSGKIALLLLLYMHNFKCIAFDPVTQVVI